MTYPYVPNPPWENLPSTDTPIAAAPLQNIENGIKSLSDLMPTKAAVTHEHSTADLTDSGDVAALSATILGFLDADNATAARAAIGAGVPGGGTTGGVTGWVTVAASNAPQEQKDGADLVCDGVDDQVQINAALVTASRTNDGFGGENRIGVLLIGGTFFVGNTTAGGGGSILMLPNTTLQGFGWGTIITPMFAFGSTQGAVQKGHIHASHTTVRDLAIGKMASTGGPVEFNGTGIKYTNTSPVAPWEVWDLNTGDGVDMYDLIDNVLVHSASYRGIQSGDISTGSTPSGTRIRNCYAYGSTREGFYVESANAHLSGCRATGGAGYSRYAIFGGDAQLEGCLASGSGTKSGTAALAGADGFNVTADLAQLTGCQAQDCCGFGFNLGGQEFTVVSAHAESNETGFRIAGNGSVVGATHTYRPGGVRPGDKGYLIAGTPKIMLTGRSRIPAATGQYHNSGSAATNSYVRVVREGAGATAAPQTLWAVG